jgi:hypothetical protein
VPQLFVPEITNVFKPSAKLTLADTIPVVALKLTLLTIVPFSFNVTSCADTIFVTVDLKVYAAEVTESPEEDGEINAITGATQF